MKKLNNRGQSTQSTTFYSQTMKRIPTLSTFEVMKQPTETKPVHENTIFPQSKSHQILQMVGQMDIKLEQNPSQRHGSESQYKIREAMVPKLNLDRVDQTEQYPKFSYQTNNFFSQRQGQRNIKLKPIDQRVNCNTERRQPRPTISQTQTSQNFRRKQMEVFDVFYQDTKKPEERLINLYNNIYKLAKDSINSFQLEMNKIFQNKFGENFDPIQKLKDYLGVSYSQIQIIKTLLQRQKLRKLQNNQRMNVIRSRILVNNYFINIKGFQILTFYTLAKILQLCKSNLFAIMLYKRVKRLSDSEQYFSSKMKSYRGLGQCFLNLKPLIAYVYITKFLISAWKLNEYQKETEAYDLLGKYYFYAGDMEKARQFHSRMVNGDSEPITSGTRKLAISKLINGSIGKKLKKKMEINEENQFEITSDDEPFDIIFHNDANNTVQQSITDTIKNIDYHKHQIQQFHLRSMPQFSKKNNEKRVIQQFQNGNRSIRQTQKQSEEIAQDGSVRRKKYNISNPSLQLGEVKDVSLISHLSPNRSLGMYQSLELSDPTSLKIGASLSTSYDKWEKNRIQKLFQKQITTLSYLMQWIYQQETKINQGESIPLPQKPSISSIAVTKTNFINRRKGYFLS